MMSSSSSHFLGSTTDMMIKSIILLVLQIPAMIMMSSASSSTTSDIMMMMNPVVELSSREELVHIAGYGEEKLSKVTMSGKVVCHQHPACLSLLLHHQIINSDHHHQPLPVSGASVGVFCGTSGKSRKSWARTTTDENGDFLIDLPSHLHAIPNLDRVCLLKVLNLPTNSDCRPSFRGKHKGIKLLSIQDGSRSYTAGTINLTTKPSETCKKMARNTNEEMRMPVSVY